MNDQNKKNGTVPKVTVIMTTYNAENFIKESLDSVLAQDIGSLEVLCVDGRSTDRTISIIKAYGRRDPRVKLLFQERPGIGAAKNCGIENASGKYITFLDADDFYVDRTALRKMYNVCKSRGARVCGALRSTLFMDGTVEKEPLHRGDCKRGQEPVKLKYIDRQYDYHFHSYLYDREMIVNSDARFAEVKAYDDTHFFIRAMLQAGEFYVVPAELYRYRCGPAYDWGREKAEDAIRMLTDQLILTRKNKLAVLHWLTMLRINYEYGGVFEKNIRAGDQALLTLLMTANGEIDGDMIRSTLADPPSEKWYLEPMMHRRLSDSPVRTIEEAGQPRYILEPLWNVLYAGHEAAGEPAEPAVDAAPADDRPWLVRKFYGGVQCVKDHGVVYTARHGMNKVENYLQRRRTQGEEHMQGPKVSVIVPVFNVAAYLRECLDSILGQQLSDIEVICGDGGSTDGSLQIIQEYAANDPRVRYISKEGSGYGQSVNECMDMARGEYIGIVESDDAITPDTYAVLYALAKENDLDWIRGDIYYYYSGMPEGEQLKRESIIYGGDFYNQVLDPQTDYRPYKSGLRTWSGIYKTSFLNSNGIRHNETPGGSYQDVGFYLKTLYYARRVYFVDKAFYMWRQDNPGSSVHYNSTKLVERSLREWKLNREYLDSHPDIGKRAFASYNYRKFFSYCWTIDMARGADKDVVKRIAAEEFTGALENGEIDKGFFEEWEWSRFLENLLDWQSLAGLSMPALEEKGDADVYRPPFLKRALKRVLRPAANISRKVVYKLMRNVLFDIGYDVDMLRVRVNETAGDTQWQVRQSAAELNGIMDSAAASLRCVQEQSDRLAAMADRLKEIADTAAAGMNELSKARAGIDTAAAAADNMRLRVGKLENGISETYKALADQSGALRSVKDCLEDVYGETSETRRRVLDHGDVLQSVKDRLEDIHGEASETRQKVLGHGDVLWSMKDRLEDIHGETSETRQKALDHGDVLWSMKDRLEDIHGEASETRQKVLDHGDVLWGVKDKALDIERFLHRNADAQIWNLVYELRKEDIRKVIGSSPMYDSAFYWNNRYGSVTSAQRILSVLFRDLPHGSVVDFGCGTGTWLWVAQILGAEDILGIDGTYVPRALLMIPQEDFLPADLEKDICLDRRFDLAISVEVAEHLAERSADVFVDNLTRSADTIIFSAAHPGQGGDGHVNEQPMEYWLEKFAARGFAAKEIRHLFENDEKIEFWYRENIVLLKR